MMIDINRVGTDEIIDINESIDHFKKGNITQAYEILNNLQEWSDRLGSTEEAIIEESLELLEK